MSKVNPQNPLPPRPKTSAPAQKPVGGRVHQLPAPMVSASNTSISNRSVDYLEIAENISQDFQKLEQSVINLVNAVTNRDSVQAYKAIDDIKMLSQNVLSQVRMAVAGTISALSRIGEVWDEYKPQLLAILNNLCNDKDQDVSAISRALLAAGLGPSELLPEDKKQDFSTYANLNYFANHGKVEIESSKSKKKSDLYHLPEGYRIAELSDFKEVEDIRKRDLNKKFQAEASGFTYNENTGLIKTPEGLKAMLFFGPEPDKKPILSFAGTEGGWGKSGNRFTKGWLANFQQNILGEVPTIYRQADALVSKLKDQYPNLVLTGFSQGGALAQYAGILAGLSINTMNTAGMRTGLLSDLESRCPDFAINAKNIHNLHLEGELVYSLLNSGTGGILLGYSYEVPVLHGTDWDPLTRHSIKSLYESLKTT